jgi:hypothetical protein
MTLAKDYNKNYIPASDQLLSSDEVERRQDLIDGNRVIDFLNERMAGIQVVDGVVQEVDDVEAIVEEAEQLSSSRQRHRYTDSHRLLINL